MIIIDAEVSERINALPDPECILRRNVYTVRVSKITIGLKSADC